jgi:hypothetical protein
VKAPLLLLAGSVVSLVLGYGWLALGLAVAALLVAAL